MILFFNAVSRHWYIWIYDTKTRDMITKNTFSFAWNESSKAIEYVTSFLEDNTITFGQLENIVVVVWPGSFTGVRTISLVVNTIAFIFDHIALTPINFFDLYSDYPIVKSSSKRDIFVKYSKNDIIEVEKNEVFEDKLWNTKMIYWDIDSDRFNIDLDINNTIDYNSFMSELNLETQKQVAPLYIKKPNIS